MPWYKILLPYGKSQGAADRIQLTFTVILQAHGAPKDAALFTNHAHNPDREYIYLSPGAALIARSIVDEFKAEVCSAPARDGTILLTGTADALQLLPSRESNNG